MFNFSKIQGLWFDWYVQKCQDILACVGPLWKYQFLMEKDKIVLTSSYQPDDQVEIKVQSVVRKSNF